MDFAKFDSFPTNMLRDLRDAAERAAKTLAGAGDIAGAAGSWVMFRMYGAAIAARGVSL